MNWNEERETYLLQFIKQQRNAGQGTDNANLKKEGWKQVCLKLEEVVGSHNGKGGWDASAKNCYSKLKCRWSVYKKLTKY